MSGNVQRTTTKTLRRQTARPWKKTRCRSDGPGRVGGAGLFLVFVEKLLQTLDLVRVRRCPGAAVADHRDVHIRIPEAERRSQMQMPDPTGCTKHNVVFNVVCLLPAKTENARYHLPSNATCQILRTQPLTGGTLREYPERAWPIQL